MRCIVCEQDLVAIEHFKPSDRQRTGYWPVCKACEALTPEERDERVRPRWEAWLAMHPGNREVVNEQRRREPARVIVGGYRYSDRSFLPGQRIYALVDPRTNALHYIGHSSNPERRLQAHLRETRGSNPDKEAWVAELREFELRPRLTILEHVAVADAVREREDRWIFHHLRRGEPLTNWQAYFRHLARAARESSLDYLTAPLDDEGWMPLVEAWNMDLDERR